MVEAVGGDCRGEALWDCEGVDIAEATSSEDGDGGADAMEETGDKSGARSSRGFARAGREDSSSMLLFQNNDEINNNSK